jgi:hypothetical protein
MVVVFWRSLSGGSGSNTRNTNMHIVLKLGSTSVNCHYKDYRPCVYTVRPMTWCRIS